MFHLRPCTALLLCFSLMLSGFLSVPAEAAFAVSPPRVSARAACLADATDGGCTVLWEHNGRERMGMASTTKIMTALVALENMPLCTPVTVPAEAVGVEGSSVWLCEGEVLSLGQLLLCVLLSSANDAAAAVALAVGGSLDGFAELMNARADALGLCDTHFVNPHGLDAGEHYTTAHDLAVIAAAALKNDDFRRMCSTPRASVPGPDGGTRWLVNHNRLLRTYDGAVGVKTGYTRACGRCLVSAAERDGLLLVAVTLDDPDDWDDHARMLDAGFSACESVRLDADLPLLGVMGGAQDTVGCVLSENVRVTLPKGHPDVTVRVELPRWVPAPVQAGDAVGTVRWYCGDTEIARCEIRAAFCAASRQRPSLRQRILSFFGLRPG